MPYRDVPGFMERLRGAEGLSPRALEFCILAAARTNEVLGARWGEIDREGAVWTVPAERMKAGREHRVPLTDRMADIIDELDKTKTSEFVFPGLKRGKPLSSMALEMVLRRMRIADATVHGFRSSFRDWVHEKTQFPDTLAEAALGHIVGDETERAYRRSDALEKRRQLMKAWAAFCGAHAANNLVLINRSAALLPRGLAKSA
jgi:integrase